jgi:mannose-6-phosphate isomerase-like protein (cupin superfamily)
MTDKINLENKLSLFSDHFRPRTIAQFNGQDAMLAKIKGPFVWHKHDDADDFFLVVRGQLEIELRDRAITLGPGELYIVPRGVVHRPVFQTSNHRLYRQLREIPCLEKVSASVHGASIKPCGA